MHSLLTINLEVRGIILSYLNARTLASLAGTCKGLKEPALNALWRDLDGIQPLIKSMGDEHDLYSWTGWDKAYSNLSRNRRMKLRRDLTKKELKILESYAPKVKKLGLSIPADVDDDLLFELCSHYPGRPLLPNLDTFSLEIRDQATLKSLQYIYPILGNSLSHFTFVWLPSLKDVHLDKPPTKNPLYHLPITCKKLKTLSTQFYGLYPTEFETTLAQLPTLTTLLCQGMCITTQVLESLSNLTALRHWEGGWLQNTTHLSHTISFPSLIHLELRKSRCADIIAFLGRLRSPRLETLVIAEDRESTCIFETPNYRSLFKKVSKFRDLRFLKFSSAKTSLGLTEHSINESIPELFPIRDLNCLELKMPLLDQMNKKVIKPLFGDSVELMTCMIMFFPRVEEIIGYRAGVDQLDEAWESFYKLRAFWTEANAARKALLLEREL